MPVTKDSENYVRVQVIFTKSLYSRFLKYKKDTTANRKNNSECIRAIIDVALRQKGY